MDQDAFRQLLHGPSTTPKHSIPAGRPKKAAPSAPSEPTFKPRKLNKASGMYRDRAAERREGMANDYAQVEAILEDFEQRAAHEGKDVVEEQRKYLGGDSQHTILVKGLDMSLLEQNKIRTGASTEDDDILEQAFVDAATVASGSKKQTREDIIRELKAKQQNGSADRAVESSNSKTVEEDRLAFEVAKQSGKFKPIGFKPIGQKEEKPKKRRINGEKNGEKKRRRVEKHSQKTDQESNISPEQKLTTDLPSDSIQKQPLRSSEPEPELVDEDFDIFAGAGEYQGIPEDDASDDEIDGSEPRILEPFLKPLQEPPLPIKGEWFGDAGREPTPPPILRASVTKSPARETAIEEVEEGGRLKALESSALPSIRDFLAMQEEAEKSEKRKARKEKKIKKKKGGDDNDD